MEARLVHKDFRNGYDGHVRTSTTVAQHEQDVQFLGANERLVDCNHCSARLLVRRVDKVVWRGQLAKRRRDGKWRLVKGLVCLSVAPPMCVSPSLWGDPFILLAALGAVVALVAVFYLLMAAADFIGKPAYFTLSNEQYPSKQSAQRGDVYTTHYVRAVR